MKAPAGALVSAKQSAQRSARDNRDLCLAFAVVLADPLRGSAMIGWEVAQTQLEAENCWFPAGLPLRAAIAWDRAERPPAPSPERETARLPNRSESPIRQAPLSPSSGPMKFPGTAVASILALATALAWLADGTVSLASPKSIPLPRPRPTLVARSESGLVTPVALHSKLSAPLAAPTAASGPDFGA